MTGCPGVDRAVTGNPTHRPVTFTATVVDTRTGDYCYRSFVVLVRHVPDHTVIRGRHAA